MRNIFLALALLVCAHLVTPHLLPSQIIQEKQTAYSREKANALCQEAKDKRDLYFDLWKMEFLKRNNMNPTFFNKHVSVIKYDVECSWNGYFRVEYQVGYDWALIKHYDQFVVLLSSQEEAYRHLPIKRDHFFDGPELSYVIDKGVNSSSITPVKSIEKLAFTSYEEALKAFQNKVTGLISKNVKLTFFVPGKLPRMDGHPYFVGRGVIDKRKNLCLFGYMNLMTAEIVTSNTYCRIGEESW